MLTLARWAMLVEKHDSAQAGAPVPMDLEWAKDGRSGGLFILQARPETVHSRRAAGAKLEAFRLKAKPLLSGKSVGARMGARAARITCSAADLPAFRNREVLVAGMTDPD